jgi:phosphoribosyl 1,2-cyclic phosphodiesterase
MAARLTILASGSSGNAALLEADGFGLLIDAGIGPRTLATRMRAVGASWDHVHAALLTHTHGDHWHERTLATFVRRKIPLYCHGEHRDFLRHESSAGLDLDAARLLRLYEEETLLRLVDHIECQPVAVSHDAGATFGFRLSGRRDLFHSAWSLAYFADLGCWDQRIADAATEVDILALEFNHDVAMQRNSGRPYYLIERCLGDEGHLSNVQAADLLAAVLARSTPGRLRQVVQLHLSRQCNAPELAVAAASRATAAHELAPQIVTAMQDTPTAAMPLGEPAPGMHALREPPADLDIQPAIVSSQRS